MRRGKEGAADEVALVGTAGKQRKQIAIIQPTGSTCAACRRPTPRWSAICRPCLATHYFLAGVTAARSVREGS